MAYFKAFIFIEFQCIVISIRYEDKYIFYWDEGIKKYKKAIEFYSDKLDEVW